MQKRFGLWRWILGAALVAGVTAQSGARAEVYGSYGPSGPMDTMAAAEDGSDATDGIGSSLEADPASGGGGDAGDALVGSGGSFEPDELAGWVLVGSAGPSDPPETSVAVEPGTDEGLGVAPEGSLGEIAGGMGPASTVSTEGAAGTELLREIVDESLAALFKGPAPDGSWSGGFGGPIGPEAEPEGPLYASATGLPPPPLDDAAGADVVTGSAGADSVAPWIADGPGGGEAAESPSPGTAGDRLPFADGRAKEGDPKDKPKRRGPNPFFSPRGPEPEDLSPPAAGPATRPAPAGSAWDKVRENWRAALQTSRAELSRYDLPDHVRKYHEARVKDLERKLGR